jgi:hypothetical protein
LAPADVLMPVVSLKCLISNPKTTGGGFLGSLYDLLRSLTVALKQAAVSAVILFINLNTKIV